MTRKKPRPNDLLTLREICAIANLEWKYAINIIKRGRMKPKGRKMVPNRDGKPTCIAAYYWKDFKAVKIFHGITGDHASNCPIGHLTVKETAEILGVSQHYVRDLIFDGKIKCQSIPMLSTNRRRYRHYPCKEAVEALARSRKADRELDEEECGQPFTVAGALANERETIRQRRARMEVRGLRFGKNFWKAGAP